uniref:Ubiquinone biosynthesis monooxygenase UbiB n=1 Tax=uncultured Thiotrichaceae bacterium TaxID=298394 RepID=A0A6S6SNY5_9GAMM|nr:MAG: Ubiquinone biosynthesis monooxygenase UbiB [uncultured Thiotrichaceae bacterium]
MRAPVPETRLARAGIAGATVLKMGMGELRHKAKRPFMSEQARETEKSLLDDKNAQLLFKALTQLRGTALKLAQMLGMELDILPEKYRKELEKSFHKVPPLNRVLVRKVIQEEFGHSPEDLFHGFESTAFAAASLGQVHAAILPDDTEVAVKIQYPGIHVAMESDMNLIRKVAVGLPNSTIVKQSIDEVHARLKEEVDYRLEAESTCWFRENLHVDGVMVPRIYDEWCTERVLTIEFCQGKHLDDWLADNPSQALRDEVGQRLYDLFIHSVLELRRLHADPNPGNYLIQADGGIALIDFGCVKTLSAHFTGMLPVLLKAYRDDDPVALLASYKKLGMEYDNDDVYEKVLQPFGRWLTQPFREDYFDFAEHADYTDNGKKLIHDIANLSGVSKLAEDFIFFDRTLYGLCKIFERLGSKVRMRHHWEVL